MSNELDNLEELDMLDALGEESVVDQGEVHQIPKELLDVLSDEEPEDEEEGEIVEDIGEIDILPMAEIESALEEEEEDGEVVHDIGEIDILPMAEIESALEEEEEEPESKSNSSQILASGLESLLSQLLTNKNVEININISIKD